MTFKLLNSAATAVLTGAILTSLSSCATTNTITQENAEGCGPVISEQATSIKNLIGTSVSSQAIDAFLAELMAMRNIPGLSLAIINNGEIAFHRSIGVINTNTDSPVTGCTVFQGASITKPLFGHFVMTFVEDGLLDLDRPLYEYLPNPDISYDDRYKLITARMALTHQTGFPNWRTDYDDKKLFIQFEPGTGFSYSGEGYEYLADVLMEIAGVDDRGLEALFQERIAKPIGLENTQIIASEETLSRTARPHVEGQLVKVTSSNSFEDFGAAYGVHTEASDFAKWMISLMNGDGLSEKALADYFRPQNVPIPEDDEDRAAGLFDYGLGFVIYEVPFGRIYAHNGNNPGYSSLIAMQKEQKWGIALLTNANQQSDLGVELIQFLNTPTE